ncbi:MAG: phytanoyl-CoA dioxygenase family protein [Chloroflexota bacterium]
MNLTPEQYHLFRHNGFLKLPEQLPESLVDDLKRTILQHIDELVEPVMRDKHGRVIRISNLWDRGGVFQDALTHPAVIEPLTSLLGPNIEFILNRHNHATLRLADTSGGAMSTETHRDVDQWSRTIVTVLFYLEDTNLQNGCTYVVPGTHMLPGWSRRSAEIPNMDHDEEMVRSGLLAQRVPVPMPAGGLLAMDGMLFHAAGKNLTPNTRMSMTAGYHSVDEIAGARDPKRVVIRGNSSYYRGNLRRQEM